MNHNRTELRRKTRWDGHPRRMGKEMRYLTTPDGTVLYHTEQGTEQPIVLSHGWPLCSDAWQVKLSLVSGGPGLGKVAPVHGSAKSTVGESA
jgi:pimeloyl-ACP methyl ester carboxylesterase